MGCESTSYISRENAIERIIFISDLIVNKKHKTLQENISEETNTVENYANDEIMNAKIYLETDLTEYTDKMIEDIIDSTFYRYSQYSNYFISYED